MSRRTGVSAKAQALAKATEAVARRDAERIEREKRLQTTLAEFFHAQGEAERIRAAADQAAAPFDAAMRESVRVLDDLGETRAGIASLTALPLSRVREYLGNNLLATVTKADGAHLPGHDTQQEQAGQTNAVGKQPSNSAPPNGSGI